MTKTPRRIGIREVEERTHAERTSIRRWYTRGDFPKPHFLGSRRVWWESDVARWESERAARPAEARPCNLPRLPHGEVSP